MLYRMSGLVLLEAVLWGNLTIHLFGNLTFKASQSMVFYGAPVYIPISSSWGKQSFSNMFRLISPLIFFQRRKESNHFIFGEATSNFFKHFIRMLRSPNSNFMPIDITIDVKRAFICKNNCIFINYSFLSFRSTY